VPLLAVFVLLGVSALPAQGRADALVAADVTRTVNGYSRYTVFDDVRAQVQGGTVTLEGKVTMPAKKADLGRLVKDVEGVKSVRNEIAVLPALASDDDLRHRVARAIYGNAAFWQYAAMPNPPIHIIVEDGRVTLTGVVRSEADRALARSLATGHGQASLHCDIAVK
jgi:hyperosmotically inducible periplasmic protein